MPVYFGFCPDEKAWHRELKKLGVPSEPYPTNDARCYTFTSHAKAACVVTLNEKLDKNNDPIGVAGLLIHEAAHVWQTMRETMGEVAPSREFEAYSLQNISMGLLKAYDQTRAPKRKTKR